MEDSTVSGCKRDDVCSAADVESIQRVNNSKISLLDVMSLQGYIHMCKEHPSFIRIREEES